MAHMNLFAGIFQNKPGTNMQIDKTARNSKKIDIVGKFLGILSVFSNFTSVSRITLFLLDL